MHALLQALVKKKKKIKNNEYIFYFRNSFIIINQSYPSSKQLNAEHLKHILWYYVLDILPYD